MNVISDFPWLLRAAIRRLGQTSTIAIVILLLVVTVLAGAGIVSVLEVAAASEGPRSYMEALWWFIVTITGVGLDARAPVTELGRASSATILLMARIFFGMFTAAVASALINRLLLEGKGMGSVTLRNHVVLCGWNSRGAEIVNQLVNDERPQEVVILCNHEENPSHAAGVHFVRGDPTIEKDLLRAGVKLAETVIILADESVGGFTDSTHDARSVLTALTVEKLNPQVYTFAEVKQAENRPHFARASVDEIVVTNDIVSGLIARASVHHGLSSVVFDLLTPDAGNEIYMIPAPRDLIGKSFDDALIHLQLTHRAILVGVRQNGAVVVNPKDAITIAQGDAMVVISRERLPLDKGAI